MISKNQIILDALDYYFYNTCFTYEEEKEIKSILDEYTEKVRIEKKELDNGNGNIDTI